MALGTHEGGWNQKQKEQWLTQSFESILPIFGQESAEDIKVRNDLI